MRTVYEPSSNFPCVFARLMTWDGNGTRAVYARVNSEQVVEGDEDEPLLADLRRASALHPTQKMWRVLKLITAVDIESAISNGRVSSQIQGRLT